MKNRINTILKELNKGVFEREEVIQLALLASISGQSIFMLGQPGVAKSLMARRIKEVFNSGKSFEYLMNRFSTPEEIFGPISISKLKNEDKYERKVEGYLPDSDVVFLDEIWKASPSIQNALLTVTNEKIYRNGNQEIKLPLKSLITASNELPAKDEGLEALWDRFLIRVLVENINDDTSFKKLLLNSNVNNNITIDEKLKITEEEFNDWQKKIAKVKIPPEVINVILVIKKYINSYNNKKNNDLPIYVSDRRWVKIVKLLQTCAFLNGRENVDLMDCFLISNTIWDEVEHIEITKEFVVDAVKQHAYTAKYNIKLIEHEIIKLKTDVENETKTEVKKKFFEKKQVKIDGSSYYEIQSKVDYYNTRLIKKTDFDKLTQYSKWTILYSGKQTENTESFDIRKVEEKLYVSSSFRKEEAVDLVIDTKTKKEILSKTPHSAIIEKWNKKVLNIVKEIDTSIKEITNYKKNELKNLSDNLFVNKVNAVHAEKNLNETIDRLIVEKKNVEEVKNKYDGLQ